MATTRSATVKGGGKVRIAVTSTGKAMKTVSASGGGGRAGLTNPQGRPAVQPSRQIAR
jgi:hypothetical protein